MPTYNQVIPEPLEMTKIMAHEKGLNNEIAVHLGEEEQKRMIPLQVFIVVISFLLAA